MHAAASRRPSGGYDGCPKADIVSLGLSGFGQHTCQAGSYEVVLTMFFTSAAELGTGMPARYLQFHPQVFGRRLTFWYSCDLKPNRLFVAGCSDSTQPVFDSAGLETLG